MASITCGIVIPVPASVSPLRHVASIMCGIVIPVHVSVSPLRRVVSIRSGIDTPVPASPAHHALPILSRVNFHAGALLSIFDLLQ